MARRTKMQDAGGQAGPTPSAPAPSGPVRLRLTRGWVIRVAGSAVILALVFAFLPLDQVGEAFARVPPGAFLGTLALFLLAHAVNALKWWLLIGAGFPFLRAFRAHLAGLAANLCLPGMAGGDVVRAGLAARETGATARVAAGAVADRMIDTLSLALLAGTGLLMLGRGEAGQGGEGQVRLVIEAGAFFLLMAGGAFWVWPRMAPRLVRRFPRLPAQRAILKLAEAFGALSRRPAALLAGLILSALVQGFLTFLAVRLAAHAGVVAPFGAWLFAWSLAKILAVLPISLGGLGVREASLAALMAPFGAAAAGVVAASLLWQAVLFAGGALGGLVWALSGASPTPAKPLPASPAPLSGKT